MHAQPTNHVRAHNLEIHMHMHNLEIHMHSHNLEIHMHAHNLERYQAAPSCYDHALYRGKFISHSPRSGDSFYPS